MGAEPSWVEKLAAVNMRWVKRALLTSIQVDRDPDGLKLMADCIHYLLRFRPFCESRWCTVGAACRQLVAALSVGLAKIVEMGRDQHLSSEHYVSSWDKLSDDVTWYASVAAMAVYVPEAVLLEFVEDDRIIKTVDKVEQTILDELAFVQNLSDDFWSRLVYVNHSLLQRNELRSAILTAASAAACFITRRMLFEVRGLPYSLCHGDTTAKVTELVARHDPPQESVSNKIWELGRIGFPLNVITRSAKYLRINYFCFSIWGRAHLWGCWRV